MGQAPSTQTTTRRHHGASRPAAPVDDTSDPFHLSPLSPRLAPSGPPPLLPRPSTASLRPASDARNAQPIPSTSLGARLGRKMSKSRKSSSLSIARCALPHPEGQRAVSDPMVPSEERLVSDHAEFGRYPLSSAKLSASHGSSTFSGPSSTLLTPRTSLPHLPSAPFTPIHQTRISHPRYPSGPSRSPSAGAGAAHSPKTRSRAEREWRARLAALSAGKATYGSSPDFKGPMPPRRKAGPPGIRIEPTASASVILPPHLVITDKSSPGAQSFVSVRSFETFGHHVHRARSQSAAGSPAHLRTKSLAGDHSGSPLSRPRQRKASVPRSVTSFYADSNGGTRPSSFAASMMLSPLRSASLEEEMGGGDADGEKGRESEAEKRAEHGGEKRKRAEPVVIGVVVDIPRPAVSATIPATPTRPLPDLPSTLSRTPSPLHGTRHHSIQLTPPPPLAFGPLPETPRSRARKERILSLPAIDVSPRPAQTPQKPNSPLVPPSYPRAASTSPSVPSLLNHLVSTPTPTRYANTSGALATPTTPHSPMTAYILSAPEIDLSFLVGDEVWDVPAGWDGRAEGRKGAHPFASFLDAPSPPRSSEAEGKRGRAVFGPVRVDSLKMSSEAAGRTSIQPSRPYPAGQTPSAAALPSGYSTKPPLPPLPPALAHRRLPSQQPPSHFTRPPLPLRPRAPNGVISAKDAILGPAEKQERTRGKVDVDLCPGMAPGAGARPPKRGMDTTDLERWLAGMRGEA